jgi:hypothetical protein
MDHRYTPSYLAYWDGDLANFLPRLASNCDPPNLCLLSSWDYITFDFSGTIVERIIFVKMWGLHLLSYAFSVLFKFIKFWVFFFFEGGTILMFELRASCSRQVLNCLSHASSSLFWRAGIAFCPGSSGPQSYFTLSALTGDMRHHTQLLFLLRWGLVNVFPRDDLEPPPK